MSDITLDDIQSGYNLSKINNNFETVESVINDEMLHLVGGNNLMQQDIDMNSQTLLNLPKPINPTDPVRLQDASIILDDGSLIILAREEDVVLSDGQTTVTFSEVTTTSSAIYISGLDSDRGRLDNPRDFTVTGSTTIELAESYPAGTICTIVQNEQTSGVRVGSPELTSSAELSSSASLINTSNKNLGKPVYDQTTNKPLWASGIDPTSPWRDAQGVIQFTPS